MPDIQIFAAPAANTLSADWDQETVRYWAVDYDSGNDSNIGYSDVSLAAAGAVAFKTLEQLHDVFPIIGNDRMAVIAIRTRAGGAVYRNKANTADDILYLSGINTYESVVVRGTDTQATAGSVAFSNSAADKIYAGAQIVPGTEVLGYRVAGAPTVNVFTSLKVAGGAPAYAAEPALLGKRIRFDSATPTVALRNITAVIWANDALSTTLGDDLPAIPASGGAGVGDVFYIEEPGVAVGKIFAEQVGTFLADPVVGGSSENICIVGIRVVGAGSRTVSAGNSANLRMAFCDITSTSTTALIGSSMDQFVSVSTYLDETAASILVGVGLRMTGGPSITLAKSVTISSSYCGERVIVLSPVFAVGSGSVFARGAQAAAGLPGITVSGAPTGGRFGNTIGRAFTTTSQRCRITTAPTDAGAVTLTQCDAMVIGVNVTGIGANPAISLNGIGLRVAIHDVIGSTGNTDVGLALDNARYSMICAGILTATPVSVTGTLGNIRLGDGTLNAAGWTDLASRTDIKDSHGNAIQGLSGTMIGTALQLTNDGNADIGQYKLVRPTGTGVVRAAIASAAATAIVIGVSQNAFTAVGPQKATIVTEGPTQIQFDAAPTAGNIAYLSTATAGNAQDTIPTVTVTQKLRLGRIMKVSGTLGVVDLHPEILSVVSDGLA